MLAALLCNLGGDKPTPGYSHRERDYLRNMGRKPLKREDAEQAIARLESLPQPAAKQAAAQWRADYAELLTLEIEDYADEIAELKVQAAFAQLLRLAQLHAEDELILLLL